MITIYSAGPECARCKELHRWLGANLGCFIVADMTKASILAELRTEGIFSMESPILRKTSPNQDDWYVAGQLFPDGKMNENLLWEIVNV